MTATCRVRFDSGSSLEATFSEVRRAQRSFIGTRRKIRRATFLGKIDNPDNNVLVDARLDLPNGCLRAATFWAFAIDGALDSAAPGESYQVRVRIAEAKLSVSQ